MVELRHLRAASRCNLQRNDVTKQVEGICITYLAFTVLSEILMTKQLHGYNFVAEQDLNRCVLSCSKIVLTQLINFLKKTTSRHQISTR